MIINQSVGFVFIHIPKSAGTSVTQFLSPLNGPFDLEIGGTVFGEQIQSAYARRYGLRKHSTLSEAWPTIQSIRIDREIFLFTFVRNPFARLFSVYRFLLTWGDYNPDLKKLMHSFPNYEAFLESKIYRSLPGPDGMFQPQAHWLKLENKPHHQISVFKVEEIEFAIKEITTQLLIRGATPEKMETQFPHANKSKKITDRIVEIKGSLHREIVDFYFGDFETFGYDTE